ncbi:MAG: alpha/beta fold hydrolase [Burkholderiales bacterium]|nr:alpha/beta fold hydrolase [Burkholderiales bacterium]
MREALAREIESICTATGAERVSLVSHSMGGLVCRAYLRGHGVRRVARLVTVGAPHAGTRVARIGLGANARQMAPGSAWLAELAGHEARALSLGALPPAVAFFSYHDNYVAPQVSGRLEWARNVPLGGSGHVEMYLSAHLADRVAVALAGERATLRTAPIRAA